MTFGSSGRPRSVFRALDLWATMTAFTFLIPILAYALRVYRWTFSSLRFAYIHITQAHLPRWREGILSAVVRCVRHWLNVTRAKHSITHKLLFLLSCAHELHTNTLWIWSFLWPNIRSKSFPSIVKWRDFMELLFPQSVLTFVGPVSITIPSHLTFKLASLFPIEFFWRAVFHTYWVCVCFVLCEAHAHASWIPE